MVTAVDLFCGAGGFTTGLESAGVEVKLGMDNNATAVSVYNANHKHAAVVQDVAAVDDVVGAIRRCGPVDIVAGSSPCQEFSLSGKQDEGALASLTVAFGSVVAAIRPRTFLLENVPNIVHSAAYAAMSGALLAAGYSITVVLMNAKYCGTAQCRRRAMVVGHLGSSAKLSELQRVVQAEQKRNKAAPPVTVRHVLGSARCGDTVYFAPRNRFYPAVLSTDRVYPTLRSHRGKCIERPPARYRPRYEDAGPIEDAHVLEPEDAAAIASFPSAYKWPCTREKAGAFIGNCVPPAMVEALVRSMATVGIFDRCPLDAGQRGEAVRGTERVRRRIESRIEMFWGGDAALHVGEVVDPGPPRTFAYVVGTSALGDERMARTLNWTPHPGWCIRFKERVKQVNRVDDTFIHVPGYDVPFRGKRQLVALGLLEA